MRGYTTSIGRKEETMGKHDKSGNYEAARIEELEARLKFAEDTNSKLKEEIANYSRLLAKHDDEAMRIIKAKDSRIAKLEAKVVKLVDAYV